MVWDTFVPPGMSLAAVKVKALLGNWTNNEPGQ